MCNRMSYFNITVRLHSSFLLLFCATYNIIFSMQLPFHRGQEGVFNSRPLHRPFHRGQKGIYNSILQLPSSRGGGMTCCRRIRRSLMLVNKYQSACNSIHRCGGGTTCYNLIIQQECGVVNTLYQSACNCLHRVEEV